MIYGFDTSDRNAATGALLVYAIYRSRDKRRYKTAPDMWEQIERFVKASAKRARTLPQFMEALKSRLSCGSVHPRWMEIGEGGDVPMLVYRDAETGAFSHAIQRAASPIRREFLVGLFEKSDARAIIRLLYGEHGWIVMLVRDRLEREKPIESELDQLETVHA